VEEVVTQAKEQVQQKAGEVKGEASQRVREQLDTRSTQLGEQVTPFGQALRRAADHLQGEGNEAAASAAHQAADHVERVAGYLTGSGSERILGDVERFARQRPWMAGLIGAAAGFVAARFLKASSENRYETSYRARSDADMPIGRDPNGVADVQVPATSPYGSM
jgi:ElaB/YqjD/DUF883 family membrane-anchored ribosome-binding protein